MAQIKAYARLKPSRNPYPGYEINKNILTIHIPDNKDFVILGPPVQSIRSNLSYDIQFTSVFKPDSTQEEVFDGVAKDIIKNFLNGYNGTIFAYGQTGTGKTYTVEGNASRYKTRGLATRALSMIYQELENRTDEHISVYLSYLEIYQEVAYDLLNPAARTMLPMVPFAKVTVVEGPGGACILRGLSLHLAATEEIAQMLLLQGQANRKVAETPVNQRSSRSHAVFTLYLQARKHNSEVIVSSKLHLVDLAGSERVSKTGVDGQQLTEAKSINLSLHHLETVIIALQADRDNNGRSSKGGGNGEVNASRSRSNNSNMSGPSTEGQRRPQRFVPYRNSLLTMVLKDSLGGNCLTAMIATISLESDNLGESISTCRFAQRVARIANYAKRNEEVDDKTLIKRLKLKISQLENQVSFLRSKGNAGVITDQDILDPLSEDDRNLCAKIMDAFVQGSIQDPVAAGIGNQNRFRECLHLLKYQYIQSRNPSDNSPTRPAALALEGSSGNFSLPQSPHHDSGDHVPGQVATTSKMPETNYVSPINSDLYINQKAYNTRKESERNSPTASNKAHSNSKDANLEDTDKIEMFISNLSKPESYKSPFEKKKEKELKKLGRKVASLEMEKSAKEEDLMQLKEETIMQDLRMEEEALRLKLHVVEEQVADQQDYVNHLREINSNAKLIAREQLVEKMLSRRGEKFRLKLNDLVDKKAAVERELGSSQSRSPDSKNEEKANRLKQGKGSLSTRQVFEMLKNEEKKHKKDSTILDREAQLLKNKQVELKTAATFEKLRGLKEMLRLSQKQDAHQENKSSKLGASQNHSSNMYTPSSSKNWDPEIVDEAWSGYPSQEWNNHSQPYHPGYSGVTCNNSSCSPKVCSSDEFSLCNHLSSETQALSKVESLNIVGVPMKYEPHHSNKFTDGIQFSVTGAGRETIDSVTSYDNSLTESLTLKNQTDSSNNVNNNCFVNDIVKRDIYSTNINGKNKFSSLNEKINSHKKFEPRKTGAEPNVDIKSTETTHQLVNVDSSQNKNVNDKLFNKSVLPPSEYINRMTSQELFDARKMGLSSRTFESALSQMIESMDGSCTSYSNVPALQYTKDPYEEFSRKQLSQRKPKAKPRTSYSASRSSNYETSSGRVNGQGSKSWIDANPLTLKDGSKHAVVGRKITDLVGTLSNVEKKEADYSITPLDITEDQSLDQTIYVDDVNSPEMTARSFGQETPRATIKALNKESWEKTYMSRVVAERERIAKIRKARWAAEKIQQTWRVYRSKK